METTIQYLQWFVEASSLKLVAMMYGGILALELIVGRKHRAPIGDVVRNCIFLLTVLPILVVIRPICSALANDMAAHVGGPWLDLTLPDGWGVWGQVLAVLTFTFVYDFFYYWHHRFQHRSLTAWSTHRLHHLDENMGVTTGYKHHWTDDLLRTVTIFLPLGILFKLEPVTLFWLSFLFAFHQLFLHANINLSFGKLDYVIMSPSLHRVHHSALKEHFGKNLAATWSFLDILFGTYVPAPKVAPPTGVPNVAAMNLVEQHIYPFRDWLQMARQSARRLLPYNAQK